MKKYRYLLLLLGGIVFTASAQPLLKWPNDPLREMSEDGAGNAMVLKVVNRMGTVGDPLDETVWNFLGVNRQKINRFTFRSDGTVQCENSYDHATWKRLDEKTILFCYGTEGAYAVLRYTDEAKNFMSGSNVAGRARYLQQID